MIKPTWFTRKESLETMNIPKMKNRRYVYWPYIRGKDEMDDKQILRELKRNKCFIKLIVWRTWTL